jgi:putative ABC transport system permease protein
MKKSWFYMFFSKSIAQRKGRVIIATISLTFAVALISSMTGITMGISEKLGSELRAYGANIIVSPKNDDYLDFGTVNLIAALSHINEISGVFLGKGLYKDQMIEIVGLEINSLQTRGWRLLGNWPRRPGEIIAGINLKRVLNLETGKKIFLEGPQERKEFSVVGFIEKGGSEDSAFIMSLNDAWDLTGVDRKLSAVLVSGIPGKLPGIAANINNTLQEALVKTLRQVAVAEESLLRKMQLLMILVTIVVLFATVVSVSSTMGANVLERRVELGLMKAIGATKSEISLFYKGEALLIGVLGGTSGYVIGYISAQLISKGAFESYISMPIYIPVLSLLTGVGISLLASYFPVQNALKYNPAVILRGE